MDPDRHKHPLPEDIHRHTCPLPEDIHRKQIHQFTALQTVLHQTETDRQTTLPQADTIPKCRSRHKLKSWVSTLQASLDTQQPAKTTDEWRGREGAEGEEGKEGEEGGMLWR